VVAGGIKTPGLLTIRATDNATITSDAGASAGGAITAVGTGVATNTVSGKIIAGIEKGQHEAGSIAISGAENATINASAVGIAVSGGISLAGGEAVNNITNSVDAYVYNDVFVKAHGNVSIGASDTSTINANVDQTSGGFVGGGTAETINHIANHVAAYTAHLAQIVTSGNVLVKANEDTTIRARSVGASGGFVGISGNVVINSLANDVSAFIDDKSNIQADNNVIVQAKSDNKLTANAANAAIGLVGVGGTVVINTFDNSTRAFVDESVVVAKGLGANTTIDKWDDATGVQSAQSISGLAIVASSVERPAPVMPGENLPQATVRAFNASGGFVGLSGIATVNVVNDHTAAFIASSNINSANEFGDDVIVRAHSDESITVVSGSVAAGFAGFGGNADRTEITSETRAFISDNREDGKDLSVTPSMVYGKDVEVATVSRENIQTTMQGVAGGAFALAGSVAIENIHSSNQAFVNDSEVYSIGSLTLRADDTANIDPTVRTGTAGISAAGASINLNSIRNTVRAEVIGSQLAATGALSVIADSRESISPIASASGVGGFAMAGSIAINTIETTTEAIVRVSDAPGGAASEINVVNLPGSGTSAQSVKVAAKDVASIETELGTGAGGLAGAGASVDVSAIRNRTVAEIKNRTQIQAGGNVTVDADSQRTMTSNVTAFGGGLIGLSGAVSYLSLGDPTNSGAIDEFAKPSKNDPSQNLSGQTDDSSATQDLSSAVGNNSSAQQAGSKVDGLNNPTVADELSGSPADRITAAIIDDASSGALKSTIDAKGSVSVTASNKYAVQQSTGAVAGGGVAYGASVSVADVTNTTLAKVGSRNIIAANGNITIDANDSTFTPQAGVSPVTQTVFGGQGGGITIDNNEARFTLTSNTTAVVEQLAELQRGADVTIEATQQADVDASVTGFSGALVAAAGGAKITPTLTVTTSAIVSDNAKIGNVAAVGSLNVHAASTNTIDAVLKVGKIAGGAAFNDGTAILRVSPTIVAHIGDVDVNSTGNVLVNAATKNALTSKFNSFAAGIVSGGAGTSDEQIKGSVTADIADGATINSGLLTVSATNSSSEDSKGQQLGGGLAGKQAAVALATINMDTHANIGDATVTANGPVGVFANSTNTATTKAGAFAVTGFGEGAAVAEAAISGSVAAEVQPGASIQTLGAGVTPFVFVGSNATNTASATSETTAIGLATGNASKARATIDVDNLSQIKDAEVIAKGAIRVESNSTNKADADSRGTAAGLLGASGKAVADAIVEGSTRAFGIGTLQSTSDYIRVQAADTDSHAKATVIAAGGGLFGSVQGAVANASISASPDDAQEQVRARIAGEVNAPGDIAVRAKSTGAFATATGSGVSIAGFYSGGSTETTSTLAQDVLSSIGNGSTVTSDGNVKVEAFNLAGWSTSNATNSGGALVSTTGSVSTANAVGDVAAVVGDATITATGLLNVQAESVNLASATGTGDSFGFVGFGDVNASAAAGNGTSSSVTTEAAVLENATLNVGSLQVTALGKDLATSNVMGTSGGFVSSTSSDASTTVAPNVAATVGPDVNVTVKGNALISAESRNEGDAITGSVSGGAVAVGDSHATTKVTPIVTSSIGKNDHFAVDHDMTLSAKSGVTKVNQGDGVSTAKTQGVSASAFYGVAGGSAQLTYHAEVVATVGDRTSGGPTIDAGHDISISTSSRINGTSYSQNAAVGAVGLGAGRAFAGTNLDNVSQVIIGAGAILTADHDLKLNADSVHIGSATADANSVGGISIVETDAFVDIDHTTKIQIGTNASTVALNVLGMTATSSSDGFVNADSEATGGVGKASANDSADEGDHNDSDDLQLHQAQRGLRIGSSYADTSIEIGENAVVKGKTVDLLADVKKSGGESIGSAISNAGGSDTDALARVELNDDAVIDILTGANITGDKYVHIKSQIRKITSKTTATAAEHADQVLAGADAHCLNDVQSDARVTAADGSHVTTHDLQVSALMNGRTFFSDATKTAAVGGEHYLGDFNPKREITWDADVVLTSGRAVLVIDAAGNVVEIEGVDFLPKNGAGNVDPNAISIFVQPIVNDHPGSALFETNAVTKVTVGNPANDANLVYDAAPASLVHSLATENGTTPFKITFVQTLDEVHIENHSSKNLILSDIIVVNTTNKPDVTIKAQSVLFDADPGIGINLQDAFGFDIAQSYEPTQIDIQQLSFSSADIVIGGTIDNPIGTTTFVNQGGSVLSGIGNSLIRTNKLVIDSGNNVGSSFLRLKVDLVTSEGLPTDSDITADGDVSLDLRGILRDATIDSNVTSFVVNAGEINAHNVDILVNPSLDQRQLGAAPSFDVDVFESVPNTHTIRKFHFRKEDPNGIFNPPLSIFGVGSTPIESTYYFSGITSTGNIKITTVDTPIDMNLQLVTDIIGSGQVDVAGNGDVLVIEKNGDLQVGLIRTTSGNVYLGSVNGSIVDMDNNGGLDVAGQSITLIAFQGSIGTKENPLEINSSIPKDGLVSAYAKGDIVLTEVVGDLNVGKIISYSGDVCLTAIRGDILDGNNDPDVDIQGVNITLIAQNGSIGDPANYLDLDSSNPTPGVVTADAFGSGNSNIWITELGTISIQSIQSLGSVSIIATHDLEIGYGGYVVAARPIKIKIGGGLYAAAGSLIQSDDVVTINGDWLDGNRYGGTTMKLAGKIIGSSIDIFGGADADSFNFTGLFSGPVTVKSGKGDDLFDLNPDRGLTGGAGLTGSEGTHPGGFTFDGEDGSDAYFIQFGRLSGLVNISDSGREGNDRLTVSGTDADELFLVNNNVPNGRDTQTGGFVATNMIGQRVNYAETLEALTVSGLDGIDVFNVQPSQTATITIDGGTQPKGGLDRLNFDSYGLPFTKSGSVLLTEGGSPSHYLPVNVFDIESPESHVTSVTTDERLGQFQIHYRAMAFDESGLEFVRVYVSVDGERPRMIAEESVARTSRDSNGVFAGSLKFPGIPDNIEHTYRFFTVGVDFAGHVEADPDLSGDVIVRQVFESVGRGLAAGSGSQTGQTSNSRSREIDDIFSDPNGLQSMLDKNFMQFKASRI